MIKEKGMTTNEKIESQGLPAISVIIVTYNCAHNLEECLKRIRAQNYPQDRIEVLIVDGGSNDTTLKVAESYQARVIVKDEYRDNQEVRKGIGLLNASYGILAYIDSDNFLLGENWLREMVQPLIENENIIGSQTLRYAYTRSASTLNRYFALFGASDPTAYYLGKQDRLSWAQNSWDLLGEAEDRGHYYSVQYSPEHFPTLGANGFLIKREVLLKSNCEPSNFFHTDVLYDLAKQGYNTYGIVKNDILHLSGATFLDFVKKRAAYMKSYYQKESSRRRYKIYDPKNIHDNLNLFKFIVYSLTLVKPLYDSVRGFLQIRDTAWFLHPLMCLAISVAYGLATIDRAIRVRHRKYNQSTGMAAEHINTGEEVDGESKDKKVWGPQ